MKNSLLPALLLIAGLLPLRAGPPNIILILADDLGYGDLGCYGQELMATPNLDRLASEGLRFTQAYSGGPVCASSRSVLMTGLHAGRTPARDNIPHYPSYLDEEDITIAEILKEAGYTTAGVGKWSLGDAGTIGAALNQGFDHWFGYLNQDHAHYFYTEYLDDDRGRKELPNNAVDREHYSHDLLTERALRYIRDSKEEPFFLYAAYTLPHFSSKDEDPDGLAVPSTEPYSDRDWPEKAKKYAAMVHRLDRDVGRIVRLVDELGLSEDTLILFSSDNGGHSTVWSGFETSGPLRGFKRDLTEGGIRVPFLARWTGVVPAGETSETVIAFEDLFPTFAALAGAEVDGPLDGIDILGVLRGDEATVERDYLYWDYGHCRRFYDQAVRLGNWKGIRRGRNGGRMELFDLSNDIGETNDLAAAQPGIVSRISGIMDEAVVPSSRYPIGDIYRGSPIWLARNHHPSQFDLPSVTSPGEGGVLRSGFVFPPEKAPTRQCHSSSLVELPDGELAAAWFGGTKESHVDNSIWFARTAGGSWQPPIEVVDGSEGLETDHRTGNPVLFQPRGTNAPLLLFYKVVPLVDGGARNWWGMMTQSRDGGASWETPWKLGTDERLGSSPHLIGPVKNKPIQWEDGTMVCPSSTEHDGWRVHFELTRDFGKTWDLIGPIDDSRNFHAIQPSLLTYPDGRWQVLCRSREGVVAQSWSYDGGRSWTPISATSLPNPNSGTDAVSLSDGRQWIIYNHSLKHAPAPSNRGVLNLAVSTNGKEWTPVLTLEQEKGEFSYPAIIQTTDGLVHVTYTWKRESIRHVVLDPRKL